MPGWGSKTTAVIIITSCLLAIWFSFLFLSHRPHRAQVTPKMERELVVKGLGLLSKTELHPLTSRAGDAF